MRRLYLLALLALGGCGEAASTYDDKNGRYISTSDYKAKYHVDRVCQHASCWDDKAGQFVSSDEWNRRQRERSAE